jgi:hypothetical protein
MPVKSSASKFLGGPARRTWRSVRGSLPAPVVDRVQGPLKDSLRKAGLFPAGPAPRRGSVGRIPSRFTWPGVAEHRDNGLRGPVFESLLGPGEGRSYLDLGAGPCQFARRAVSLGWDVTAVDGRTERLPDDLEGIRFIQHDVRTFDVAGYHTIAILGLLYHLPLDDQVALLRSCAGSRVILETQVHTHGYVPPAAEPWGHKIVTIDGLSGVVFPEGDNPMASLDNPTSFWLDEAGLLEVFARCGYRSVELVEPMHHSKYGTRRFYVLNG